MPRNSEWRRLNTGSFWKPGKRGECRIAEITDRRVVDTKYGVSPILDLVDIKTGELFSVWSGTADLRKLNCVPLGGVVRITYEGEQKIPGRKQMKEGYNVDVKADVKLVPDWFNAAGYSYGQSKGRKKSKRTKSE